MAVPSNPILDAPLNVGQAQSTVRWRVVDRQLDPLGDVRPLAASDISASVTGTAARRRLGGLRLSEADLRDLNPFRDMLAPTWVLGDGTEWPLGVYAFTDLPKQVSTGVSTLNATMLDQSWLFDQQLGRTVSIAPWGRWLDLVDEILDSCAIQVKNRDLVDSDAVCFEGNSWLGERTKAQVLGEAAQAMGCLPPYFDNNGILVLRAWPDFRRPPIDITYDTTDGRMIEGSLLSNDNNLDAPNVYRVVGSGVASAGTFGEAVVSADVPWSVQNRGVEIVHTVAMQGLMSSAQAQQIAETLAASASAYRTFQFDAFADPRHDLFMTVGVDGEVWREVGFRLRLSPGGPMQHSLTSGGFPTAG